MNFRIIVYASYDLVIKKIVTSIIEKFITFATYINYFLYMNSNLKRKDFKTEVSQNDVRLNDRTIAWALTLLSARKLHLRYFIEFNNASMIRAIRVSLKHVYKKFMKTEIVNVYENVISEEEWYYLWWRNLHCLMSKKNLNAELY